MIKLKGIYSERAYTTWPSYQLVYEWENIMSEKIGIPIKKIGTSKRILYSIIKKLKIQLPYFNILNKLNRPRGYYLYHVMTASNPYMLSFNNNVIPIIIDFFLKKEDLVLFYKRFENCKCLLVSSLEVVDFLTENKCPISFFHFPISLPDLYKFKKYEKKYQILLAGRQNILLKEYLNKYLGEFPETEFVYESETEKFIYISNKFGLIGNFSKREDFIKLLRLSKVFFYTTPGMDEGANRTNGFNQVTPKYLELLAANVKIIARYPNNKEADYYELNKVCQNIENYEQFRQVLSEYLKNSNSNYLVQKILEKHYTSNRIELLNNILAAL